MENTSKRDPIVHLLGAMSDGPSKYITDMESDGQRQLVASEAIPTKGSEMLPALGFTLGAQVPGDKLFRNATLPYGWSKQPSDHSMWSYIVDQHGRRRVSVFYKAAFYDRDAFCNIETPCSYLRSVLWDGGKPVLDDSWLTAEIAGSELAKLRDEALGQATEAADYAKGASDAKYWNDRVKKHQKDADKAEALRLAVTQ